MKVLLSSAAIWRALFAALTLFCGGYAWGDNDNHGADDITNQLADIQLSATQQQLADIKVATLKPALIPYTLYAPGEVKVNGYSSYLVSPRTDSVVLSRHAILGDHMVSGQPLVTLFSETIAEAQADYLIAFSEWQRTKKLALGTVSDNDKVKSETAFNAAYGRLLALGLTDKAIAQSTDSEQLGQYNLVAKSSGVILADDFIQGQRVAAGETVMLVANEQTLWVEASLPADNRDNLPVGTKAELKFGEQSFQAHVIQQSHIVDTSSRTRSIRLAVDNQDDQLHAGMFVDVNFQLTSTRAMTVLPETALVRDQHGDWSVFIAHGEQRFSQKEVTLGRELDGYRQVLELPENSRVVIEGAFFIAAQIAKSGFDTHNH